MCRHIARGLGENVDSALERGLRVQISNKLPRDAHAADPGILFGAGRDLTSGGKTVSLGILSSKKSLHGNTFNRTALVEVRDWKQGSQTHPRTSVRQNHAPPKILYPSPQNLRMCSITWQWGTKISDESKRC